MIKFALVCLFALSHLAKAEVTLYLRDDNGDSMVINLEKT